MKMKHKVFLPESEIKELRNKLNDNWVSDEEKEEIRMILRNCERDPSDQTFNFNPLYILYGLWCLVALPFGFLWLGIKKLLGYGRHK